MIKAFPKIFAIGTDYICDIFKEEVEITEKIDGSQFVFGKIGGIMYYRSKGKQIFSEAVDKMFKIAVDYAESLESILTDGVVYYCEYLRKPRHNSLVYERTPKNNLILFAVGSIGDKFVSDHADLIKEAEILNIEYVPLVYHGKINSAEDIFDLIKKESVLGGVEMEGIVVKNYHRPFLLGGHPIPVMAGKYVSEKFKEVHGASWAGKTGKGKFEIFKDGFRTEARWEKAMQHLRDSGNLENSPRDIGKLIKEIQRDIYEEETDNIKSFLFKEFGSEVIRHATRGFPEWYKEVLLKNVF